MYIILSYIIVIDLNLVNTVTSYGSGGRRTNNNAIGFNKLFMV